MIKTESSPKRSRGRPRGTGTKEDKPIGFRPEQEDRAALAALRERHPNTSDSDLLRMALRKFAE